jgi:hypothetical protein
LYQFLKRVSRKDSRPLFFFLTSDDVGVGWSALLGGMCKIYVMLPISLALAAPKILGVSRQLVPPGHQCDANR